MQWLFADCGYQGPIFEQGAGECPAQMHVEIAKRSDSAMGFEVLQRRWAERPKVARVQHMEKAVEEVARIVTWLNRRRRPARDFENKTRKAPAFLKRASMRLMTLKLCNHSKNLRINSKAPYCEPVTADRARSL